jgi:hypothetical protein
VDQAVQKDVEVDVPLDVVVVLEDVMVVVQAVDQVVLDAIHLVRVVLAVMVVQDAHLNVLDAQDLVMENVLLHVIRHVLLVVEVAVLQAALLLVKILVLLHVQQTAMGHVQHNVLVQQQL